MVRILRDGDPDDYADIVVDSETVDQAKAFALAVVSRSPNDWFDQPDPPTYSVDESNDVEELDGTEYESAKL